MKSRMSVLCQYRCVYLRSEYDLPVIEFKKCCGRHLAKH